jgi:tetratricopeptide (TPR) repeat protein
MCTSQLARAHTLLEQGDLAKAETLYREILALEPNQASAIHGLARVAMASDQPSAAAELLQTALRIEPGNPEHWLALARALALAGYPDDAGKVLEEGQAAGVLGEEKPCDTPLPRSARDTLAKALKDLERGHHERAIRDARQVARRFPESGHAAKMLGTILMAAGHHAQALEPLQNAARRLPDDGQVMANLGGTLQILGHLPQARACLERAVELIPEDPVAHSNLSALLQRHREFDAAIKHADIALKLRPDSPAALINKGNVLRSAKRFNEARELFEKAVRLDPANISALTNLGAVAKDTNEPELARSYYEQAIEHKPDHPESLHNLGSLYKDLGQPARAQHYYELAWQAAPQRPEHAEALVEFRTFTDPQDPLLDQLAEALQSGRLSRVDKVYAGFALGKGLLDLGRNDDAFSCYEMGNKAAHTRPCQLPEGLTSLLAEQRRLFDGGFAERIARFGLDGPRDIFVLGFSRSGKSLVETLVAQHPATRAQAERDNFAKFARQRFQDQHGQLSVNHLEHLSSEMANRDLRAWLEARGPDTERLIWTLPGNIYYLSLLAALLPASPLIFCRRDLMDLGLSCYFKRYREGHEYTYDLTELGQHMRLYDEYIDLWLDTLPNPMLEVQYETMVRQPKETARTIYDFVGLDFRPEYLDGLEANRGLVEHIGPAHSLEAPAPIRDDFIGFSRPFEDRLEPLVRGYESVDAGK